MRSAPLLRASEVRALRELIKAAPAVWPYPGHGTLAGPKSRAKAGADAEALTPKAEPVSRPAAGRSAAATVEPMTVTAGETAPIPELAAAGSPTIDRAGDGQGQAPEGTRGAAAAVVDLDPANACPPAQRVRPIDLKAAPSAMDARFARSAPQVVALGQVLLKGETRQNCSRCEISVPLDIAARIGRDCIESPCPMKARA